MPVDGFDRVPDGEPEFLSEKSIRDSIRVKRAPDAAAVGRGTLRNSGKVAAIFYENLESYKEQTLAVAGPGDYFAEYCVDGRTQQTWPFHVDARAPSEVVSSSEQRYAPEGGVDARLDRIERALLSRSDRRPRNRARRVRRVLRREQPSASAAMSEAIAIATAVENLKNSGRSVESENIAEIVRREVREAVADLEPEREPDSISVEKYVLTAALEDKRLRDRLSNGLSRWIDPDSAPQKHWFVEALEMSYENADKLPLVAQGVVTLANGLLGGIFKRTPQPQPIAQPHPAQIAPAPVQQIAPQAPAAQPAAEPPRTFQEEADATIEFVLTQCRDNAPVRKSARSVVWLIDTFPEAQGIAALLSLPGETLCPMLAAQLAEAPQAVEVLKMEHAPAWFDSLKEAIAKRRNVKEVAPVETPAPGASNNGTKAEAAA